MSLKNLSATNKILKLLEKKYNNKRIRDIYKKFSRSLAIKENFVVAVSGGPDSLALAFLSKIYSIKNNLISKYIIIDHKLRSNSTEEARLVKKILKKSFIDAEILTWNGKKPSKNIQAIARKKRYELLITKSNSIKINNILVGHHQNDLFENFFIRILRGSGLKGLISLDKKVQIDTINIIRPLLNQKKEDLIFISESVFNFSVKDPSNKNPDFKRTKIRNFIEQLKLNGLDESKFSNTLENLKYSNSVIEFYVNKNLIKNSFFFKNENYTILNHEFFEQPYEVVFRSLSHILKNVGRRYYAARGKKIDKIISQIKSKRQLKVTLGGCVIERVNQTVIISKEY